MQDPGLEHRETWATRRCATEEFVGLFDYEIVLMLFVLCLCGCRACPALLLGQLCEPPRHKCRRTVCGGHGT